MSPTARASLPTLSDLITMNQFRIVFCKKIRRKICRAFRTPAHPGTTERLLEHRAPLESDCVTDDSPQQLMQNHDSDS
ncbi:hypothetical protein EYF80_013657 [Liparis tanakae]|uniref:Uncharacterized protein n=1 Tax=Liparis tanakae TaxID=230148 RepID=A0A4Z2IDT8_9TELE|nr:hypothetical protein EYF80_013657 [Liparis tanakae]